MDLKKLVRSNINRLTPYSSARKEFAGVGEIFLDANENSFGSPLARLFNRYPDPQQSRLKQIISAWHNVRESEIFIGNGSDEAIDLLFRIFCEPRRDAVLICPPTYGMYEVSAEINDVAVKRVNLKDDFRLDSATLEKAFDEHAKLLFICSPNNPTGNAFARAEIIELAENFGGIVVVDEAYIHFSNEPSMLGEIRRLPNLVVLQTFSKAWGLAALRVGMAFANEEIIELFNKVKPPYNVSGIAQEAVLEALENRAEMDEMVLKIISERENLVKNLQNFAFVEKIYPSDANFVLVKVRDAKAVYRFLLDEKIVVRDRSRVELCAGCLRITVGTSSENRKLLKKLDKFTASDTENR